MTQDDEARYRALCERIRAWHQERGIPFDYPPATVEQVRETEAELGIPLPPLLRMLYAEVANGGNLLSPLHEFFGVVGGYLDTFGTYDSTAVGRMVSRSGWQLNPCMAEALERFPGYAVFADTRPEGFLMLSNQLGVTFLECSLRTGAIYLTGLGRPIPSEDPGEELGWLTTIEFMASSLEDCLNAMLEGTLYTRNRAGSKVSDQAIEAYIKLSCSEDPRAAWRGLYRFSPDFSTLKEPDLEEWDIDASAFEIPDS
jgi:hypothetical protein